MSNNSGFPIPSCVSKFNMSESITDFTLHNYTININMWWISIGILLIILSILFYIDDILWKWKAPIMITIWLSLTILVKIIINIFK